MRISVEYFEAMMSELKNDDFTITRFSTQMEYLKDYPNYLKLQKIDGKYCITPNTTDDIKNSEYTVAMGGIKYLMIGDDYAKASDLLEYLLEENDISFSLSVL